MHLKRLEAFGFKSFADKVIFDFEPGVTCLVGPNGCGKSNVVDAVKWVLGEQSAKAMRGGEMLDVIFNGSGNRKPLNFAEVTLIFDNASGKLPLAAPEVAVTRRLYRSGDSEYLINKALCRLRDIRELFWDTGIGTASYSVIEQGRIAALLEANSKDRRILFEEAAGIHKYKERKKIALRKLERVEQNVARLTDLLGEVERNLKTVTRQAEKAKKAREFTDRLRQVKLDILLHDTFAAETALREVTGNLALCNERVTRLAEELAAAQATTVAEQTKMSEIDLRLSQAQSQLSDARARQHRLEAEIEAERRQIEELKTESVRAYEASKAAGDRAATIAQERERVELDHARAQEFAKENSEKAQVLTSNVNEQQEGREALLSSLESARREAVDSMGRRTGLQDTLTRAEADLSGIEYRVRRTHAQMTKAEDQLRFAQAELEEVRGRIAQVQQRREVLEAEQRGYRELQQRTEAEIERLHRAMQEVQRELENKRSRLTALEGLRESGEGLSPGARAVLTTLRLEPEFADEVHGLVADCLSVDPKLEQAVEAALGSHIETIVVSSAQAAQALAKRLDEQELGRATFLPLDRAEATLFARALDRRRPHSDLHDGKRHDHGCLGFASDLVSCDEQYRALAQALLGDTLVYENETGAADAFHADCGSTGVNRVTLAGVVFESNGAFSGGRHKSQRLGLIARKNEIARLAVQIDDLQLQVSNFAERIAFLERRAQKSSRDDSRLQSDLNALAISATELKGMLGAIEREEARSSEEKNLAVQEIHELEAERAAHLERVLQMRSDLEAAKKHERELAFVVQTREASLAQRETMLAHTREQLADVEREAATWRERATALEREAQSLSMQCAERRDEAEREQARAQALEERCNLLINSLAEKDRALAESADAITKLTEETGALQAEKEAARMSFDQARGREREISTEQEAARGELSSIHEREVNLRVRLESKLEQARSEFQLDALAELAQRGGPPKLALSLKKSAAKEESASEPSTEATAEVPAPEAALQEPEEPAVDPAVALQEAQALVRQLEEKLAKLGPVNMYALEELEELQKRHSFLKVQHEDLESARASLRDVIARINRRSRTLFQETFDAVKTQFNEMFRKLFGGGKSDLILEEGEDILEAGIEIIARPPGKEPRAVSLLSGGEKTMTMIALLFAIFRSRPAPFCILDEVDAPLDEANVDRFNLIVREFLDRSQFVVISHNKKTMSYADILYGITMPEPGVSKRIAIKFSEIEQHLPMDVIEKEAAERRAAAQATAKEAKPAEVPEDPSPVEAAPETAPVENQQQTVGGE
ncbi:MAG TPA: chromosome segregation protein SMC [Planctomycetota bacterium]|nr:chromosome segregation protein SMC [Planctomycetota bacterium]